MKRKKSQRRSRQKWWTARNVVLRLLAVSGVFLVLYVAYLDFKVRDQFEGKRWALPARVFARPLELYVGAPLSAAELTRELKRLGYHFTTEANRPGQVANRGKRFHLYTRSFAFWEGLEPALNLSVGIRDGWITAVQNRETGQSVDLVRLDPVQIAAIYPAHNEDRVLVKLEKVPPTLINALLVVEDRTFYQHHGISPRSVGRALVANLRAGGVVQGGSTLTQQLVKNFFLSNERTLRRKINEAIMALLLEWHYAKDEILEAYLNEVYLGQDGTRAIHGFGLASKFYFERNLAELDEDQLALLVGLVKGPSYYDPRRHPERARTRRNLVLELMLERDVLDPSEAIQLSGKPLGTLKRNPLPINAHPAFLDLVRRQLRRDYREEDLNSQGLRIFTTLDPDIQQRAERVVVQTLEQLEKEQQIETPSLQGGLLVTRTENAEVLAVIGDRDTRFTGFNRALDASRPIGSLIKPAVYLRALERASDYTLASLLEDMPLTVSLAGGQEWQPHNYDDEFRGTVTLFDALVHSYNVPTARLGLELGVPSVVETLQRLGVGREYPAYPSLLLGAAEMTPAEVTQMYQTIAGGGFRSPMRSITAVVAADGAPLQRYPLRVEQVIAPGPMYLLNTALQGVVREGTAVALSASFRPELGLAGKTGTTNDLRDSWFAGFSGDRLAVVWIGRDDNQPMGLTGSAGALRVWRNLMRGQRLQPLVLTPPAGMEHASIDRLTGLRADVFCENRVELPFLMGSAPHDYSPCARSSHAQKPLRWIKGLLR